MPPILSKRTRGRPVVCFIASTSRASRATTSPVVERRAITDDSDTDTDATTIIDQATADRRATTSTRRPHNKSNQDRLKAPCPLCSKPHQGGMVACENCEYWYHNKCAGYSAKDIKRIKHWYCDECVDDGFQITWESRNANASEASTKGPYYHFDEIVDHRPKGRYCQPKEFLVHWRDYDDPEEYTWEKETQFNSPDGIDYLNNYLKSIGKPPSKVVGIVGASSKGTHNPEAWVPLNTIINTARAYKRTHYRKLRINLHLWTDFAGETGIYFFGFGGHCYVIWYVFDWNHGYIADGDNSYHENKEVQEEVNEALGINLTSCKFLSQTRVDHCGSSAVLIALEFMRAWKHHYIPSELIAVPSLAIRIRRQMHLAESKINPDLSEITSRRPQKQCNYCYKKFWHKQYSKLGGHESSPTPG